MPIFKVKSAIKKDGETYAVGAEVELTAKEAKELAHALVIDAEATPELAPKPPRTKAEKEAAAQAKKAKAASERAQKEAGELGDGGEGEGEGDENDDAPKTVSRETTQEDLDADPKLVEDGVKVGDVRDYPVAETTGDDL